MKRLFFYIYIMAALLLTACSDDFDFGQGSDGHSACVRFAIPTWNDGGVETRAGVSSADIGISEGSMQLLCFDINGFFVGMADNTTTTPDENDKYNGSITGEVPSGTCRVHFIANANITDDPKWLGMSENTLIASLEAKVDDDMVYWGYKRFATESEMTSFLTSDETVLMLRNEAKVSVELEEQTESLKEDKIESVYLTVCDDVDKGTLTPFDYSNLDNPFDYDEQSQTSVTIARDAEKRTRPTVVDEDKEQFIFESNNTEQEPIKVVLKVEYTDGTIKYHQIQLLNSNYKPHEIRRNHNYKIHITKLDQDLGYDSFDGAVNGKPSNNPSTSVADIVPEVTKGEYALRILSSDEGTTYRLYKTIGEKTIEFEYGGDTDMTASDFNVKWTTNNGTFSGLKLLKYDEDKETGTIEFRIDEISDNIEEGVIYLQDTKHGLSRSIHVYAANEFVFNGNVTYHENLTATIKETEVVEHTETVTGPRTKTILLNSASAIVYTVKWSFGYYYISPQSIAFTLEGDDDITSSDISVAWKSDVTNSAKGSGNPSISSYSNGTGYISVPITGPTDRWNEGSSVYSGTLVLTVKGSDYTLTREITIYTTMNQNNVTADLTPAAATTATVTRTETYDKVWYETEVVEKEVSGSNVYALTFKIPKSYPSELLPVTVKIATSELQPYNSMNKLGVVVESTKDIGHDDWNYWYTYSADETNCTSEDDNYRTYTIYFKEIRSSVTDKGNLYLKADHFTTATVDIPGK